MPETQERLELLMAEIEFGDTDLRINTYCTVCHAEVTTTFENNETVSEIKKVLIETDGRCDNCAE